MPTRNSLASFSILFALSLPSPLVSAYNCDQLSTNNQRCRDHNGPGTSYPNCLVEEFSVSAFIACADVQGPDTPRFTRTEGGEQETVGVIELLTSALDTPSCSACPLAGNIRKAANEHREGSFAGYLCSLNPVDAGICCLGQCLGEVGQERSIEAYCRGRAAELMAAPLLPKTCVSNRETDDTTANNNGDSSGGGGDTSNDDGSGDGNATGSSDEDASMSSTVIERPSTIASTIPTTSPVGNNAATTSTTSAPSTPQETPNIGAGARRGAAYIQRLGLAILPIIAGVV
ncbi:MAG: hypothetical protein Q9186_004613 [Xanthomendoza sp. 1 TL-2023]